MGGGDLNLKKSWHPQTLKNIERVWKAEQQHEAERKKIEELQKELREERAREEITRYAQETGALRKKDDRLDWMYQGPGGQVSREEYLLGRPIDKQITQQYEEQESGPCAQTGLLPGSIFNPTLPASTLDLAAKIREDPLFVIRKREEEKKRNILTNPVKMKMIKKMLRQNLEKEKKKKRKKEKKEKRKEKYKKHSTSDEYSGSEEKSKHKQHKSLHRDMENPASSSTHRSGYGLQFPANSRHHTDCHQGKSFSGKSSQSPVSPKAEQKNHTTCSSDPAQAQRNSAQDRERAYKRYGTIRPKMSSEEKRRKRDEMLDFARQRDKERIGNVQKYLRQDEEEKERDGIQDRHVGFIHDMKLESAASSLEDRVKRNIHSLQRTPAALEKNFMKR
ncbi:pre-mRNA-splicing factor CWC25 homolog [Paramormyrops kingsleyae]|uniref:pre-mRNA-splicing factor CWC25 homolog n=1 Tax=Paramormyrops kingsleyae TaxID=1676925 RepID=UPI003B977972